MHHTLITYIFDIVSIFIKMTKTPQVTRRFKVDNTVDHQEVKMATMMYTSLMDQLQLCPVNSSTQNIFAQALVSFQTFFLSLCKVFESLTCPLIKRSSKDMTQIEQKRPYKDITQNEQHNAKKLKSEPKGVIINATVKEILTRGLERKYCSDFLRFYFSLFMGAPVDLFMLFNLKDCHQTSSNY